MQPIPNHTTEEWVTLPRALAANVIKRRGFCSSSLVIVFICSRSLICHNCCLYQLSQAPLTDFLRRGAGGGRRSRWFGLGVRRTRKITLMAQLTIVSQTRARRLLRRRAALRQSSAPNIAARILRKEPKTAADRESFSLLRGQYRLLSCSD